jgi:hypothetical protein
MEDLKYIGVVALDKKVQLHFDFYERISSNIEVKEILEREKITVLDGFIKNIELVHRYYQTFYSTQEKRIVLCGY